MRKQVVLITGANGEIGHALVANLAEQAAEAIGPSRLLCGRRERPRSRRAAEQRDEIASLQIEWHPLPLASEAA